MKQANTSTIGSPAAFAMEIKSVAEEAGTMIFQSGTNLPLFIEKINPWLAKEPEESTRYDEIETRFRKLVQPRITEAITNLIQEHFAALVWSTQPWLDAKDASTAGIEILGYTQGDTARARVADRPIGPIAPGTLITVANPATTSNARLFLHTASGRMLAVV